MIKIAQKLPKIITYDEFKQIEEYLKKSKKKCDSKYLLAFRLGFEAGLRISEIVGLKYPDKTKREKVMLRLSRDKIDFNRNTIRIENAKGNKDRIVPLPKSIRKSHLQLLPIKLSRRSLQNKITTLGKEVLGKAITFHTLRAGFATHLMNKGMPMHQVQVLMGHARGDMTLLYARANPVNSVNNARGLF